MEYKNFKVVYRKYASLYFIIAVDNTEVGNWLETKFGDGTGQPNHLLMNVCFVLNYVAVMGTLHLPRLISYVEYV